MFGLQRSISLRMHVAPTASIRGRGCLAINRWRERGGMSIYVAAATNHRQRDAHTIP